MGTTPANLANTAPPAHPLLDWQVDSLQKIQKAAQQINSILDLDELIDNIVNEVSRSFGLVETHVYLHDEANAEMVMAGVCGCTVHCKGFRLKVGKEGMVGYVASTGQMRYAPDVHKDPYYIGCEDATNSEVAIPLHVGQHLIGVFTASHPDFDAFSRQQLRILQALCEHMGVAIYNARRFQLERDQRQAMSREVEEARAIQQALLPKSSPYIPGFAISGKSIPARAVGGDWYDFIPFADGRWGIVLADVAGKGTAAALLMSATRGMLRSLAEASCTPSEVLTKLNGLLVEDFPAGKFVTLVYAVLDPANHSLTFANAGHLPPLLVEQKNVSFLDTERGLPLGLSCGDYSEKTLPLAPGSRLVFYSDGISEAVNAKDEEYGIERLSRQVSGANASAISVLEDVRAFANGSLLQDDATVVFLQVGDGRVSIV
jgi:phosphoserine phosphatase RsbU/P